MSKFVEDFEWNWESNQRVKAEMIPEVIERLKKGETLEAENKSLREALIVIAPPKAEGYAFTSRDNCDKYHYEKMQEWVDKYINTETRRTLITNYYCGATLIAEQVLKNEKANVLTGVD